MDTYYSSLKYDLYYDFHLVAFSQLDVQFWEYTSSRDLIKFQTETERPIRFRKMQEIVLVQMQTSKSRLLDSII
jgi:hypothetical protein